MCHGQASSAFPEPAPFTLASDTVQAAVYGSETASARVAVLPDIYGSNPFYQGFASHLAAKNAQVFLIDTFAGLGDMSRATREAAFERRHRLRDKAFVDAFQAFADEHSIGGIVGFCLGGLYVFELARREVDASLVAFYPFPQGLPNDDPLDVPFEYLPDVRNRHTVLVGDADGSLGDEVIARLTATADANPAIDLHVYESSGHGFLADLDSDDELRRRNARDALSVCESTLGL